MTTTPAATAAELTKRAEAAALRPLTRAELLKAAAGRRELEAVPDPRFAATVREQAAALTKAADHLDDIPQPVDAEAWRLEAASFLSAFARTSDPDLRASATLRANIATEVADALLPATAEATRKAAALLRRRAVDVSDPVARNELAVQVAALEDHADRWEARTKSASVPKAAPADPLKAAIAEGVREAMTLFKAARTDQRDLSDRIGRIEANLRAGGSAPARRRL